MGGVAVATLISLTAACGSPTATSSGPGPNRSVPASDAGQPVSGSPSAGAFREVEFPGADGQPRSGRLYGGGPIGVILSHMGRGGDRQDDWDGMARLLAGEGYQVLTFNRRSTLSATWREVLDAADFVRQQGADRIVAGGASIGAMASLRAIQEPGAGLAGAIWLAGIRQGSGYDFRRSDVARIGCPLLFMSGAGDIYGAAADTEQLYRWATGPKELLILDSAAHGTDILEEGGRPASRLRDSLIRFLEQIGADAVGC